MCVKYLTTSMLPLRLYKDIIISSVSPMVFEFWHHWSQWQNSHLYQWFDPRYHKFNFQICVSVILLSVNLAPHLHWQYHRLDLLRPFLSKVLSQNWLHHFRSILLVIPKNYSIVRNSRKIYSVNLKDVKFSAGPVHSSERGKLTENNGKWVW